MEHTWCVHLVFHVIGPSSKLVLINDPDPSLNDGTLVELALLLLVCRFRSCEDGVRFRTAHVPAGRVSVVRKEEKQSLLCSQVGFDVCHDAGTVDNGDNFSTEQDLHLASTETAARLDHARCDRVNRFVSAYG